MDKIKELIKKYVNRETISYLVFGVLTTVVSLITYLLFTGMFERLAGDKMIYVSNVLSWVCAVTFAYITNRIFVFRSQNTGGKAILKEMAAFYGARLLSLGFEEVWLWVTVDLLHFNDFICKIIAQFVIVALNYVFSKLFIFKKHNTEKEDKK